MQRVRRRLPELALVLSALSLFLSAYLFTREHDLSVQGCVRQNDLRRELNAVLHGFHEPSRFKLADCRRAWALFGPEPPPRSIRSRK